MNMKTKKRTGRRALALLLLTATLFALFAGCVKGGEETGTGTETEPEEDAPLESLMLPEVDGNRTWKVEKVGPADVSRYYALAPQGDGYIFYGRDDVSLREMTLDRSFAVVESKRLDGMQVMKCFGERGDGSVYTLDLLEEDPTGYGPMVHWIARDGEELFKIPNPSPGYTYVSILVRDEGIYAANYNFLLLNGKQIKIPETEWTDSRGAFGFLTLRGRDYAVVQKDVRKPNGEWYLAELQGEKTGPLIETNVSGEWFFPSPEEGVTDYVQGTTIWRTDGKTREKMAELASLGLAGGELLNIWEEEGRFVLLTEKGIFTLTETEEDGGEEKKIVLGANCMTNHFQSMIDDYNLSGRGRVEVKFYDSAEKLNLALTTREVDIACDDNAVTMFDRARSGALRPITELLDVSGIYPNLVECGSKDGKCWFLPVFFELCGVTLPRDTAGERKWFKDAREMEEALEKLPQQHFYKAMDREFVLQFVNAAEWIDPVTNKAHFNEESFVAMLEFLNRFAPDSATAEANMSSDPSLTSLFSPWYVTNGWIDTWNRAYEYDDYVLGNPGCGISAAASLLPMPGNGRYHGPGIVASEILALTAKEDRDEEIRDFLSYLYLEGRQTAYQESLYVADWIYYFPSVTESEAMINKFLDLDFIRSLGSSPDARIREEDFLQWRKELSDLLRSADHYETFGFDEAGIVMREEVKRYFAGEITAEKAAEYIQNRISIMLAEKG